MSDKKEVDFVSEKKLVDAKYYVKDCAITTRRGILCSGEEIKYSDLASGKSDNIDLSSAKKAMKVYVKSGKVVKG